MDYYLQTQDGQSAGPYSIDQIKAFWAHGKVTLDTPCWSQGAGWQSIRTLESRFKPPSQAPPRPASVKSAEAITPFNPLAAIFLILYGLFLPPLGFLMGLMTLTNRAHRKYSLMILIASLILPTMAWEYYQSSPDYGNWPKFVDDTLDLTGVSGGAAGPSNVQSEPPPELTKEQWKASVPGSRLVTITGVIQCKKADLFAAVGPPSHTSTMGNEIYLYWICTDGTIQINCEQTQYAMSDMVIGGVNDY